MTSRRRKKVGAFALAVGITLVLGACVGDDAGASQGTTKPANRTVTPRAAGGAGTGPAETAPPSAPPSAAPDVVEATKCSVEATGTGDRVKVRFEVHQSPVGDSWRIHLRHMEHNITPGYGRTFFRGTRVARALEHVRRQPARDSGVLVVQRSFPGWNIEGAVNEDGVAGRAVDRQTGEVCEAEAWYR